MATSGRLLTPKLPLSKVLTKRFDGLHLSGEAVRTPPMKTLIAIIIFGWVAVVTFCGPELARAINGPEPVKAKAVRRAR